MSSPPPVTDDLQSSPLRARWQRTLRSRWTFVVLQLLDLLTTLAAFHVGAREVNPLVARLTLQFGRLGGVLMSKVIAVAIAMGVRRLVWVVNLFYAGVVGWNIAVLLVLSLKRH
jgi:uncharacterized protein DUF5658